MNQDCLLILSMIRVGIAHSLDRAMYQIGVVKSSRVSRSVCLTGKLSVWLRLTLGAFSIWLMPTFFACPALGAERVILSYGILERSIPVDSLETYARTGNIDANLATYAHYADPTQLSQLRRVLLTRIPLTAVEVSQFFYSPIGERLLDRLGTVIQPGSGSVGASAIRAALILAAADPEGLTPLNVLRKFPLDELEIDLAQSLEIASALEELLNQTQQAVTRINQQSAAIANTNPLTVALPGEDLQQPGRFTWKKRTITLIDRRRDRSFAADIYLPQPLTRHPIVIISHGLGSDRLSFAYLAQHLASYGFVVAVPEHPGSDSDQLQALFEGRAAEVTSPREFVDRPLDIKYLLDELNRLSRSDSEFWGHLNLQQVGVIGQSFGGYTALALAGATIRSQPLQTDCRTSDDSFNLSLLLQCLALRLPKPQYDLSDARVKAAIAINPIGSSILGQESFSQINLPTMIVASSADTIAPALVEQIQPFTWLTPPNKYLVLINNATHFSTIKESPNAAIPLPEQLRGPSPALARRYMQALSVAFFKTYIANQANYRPYLSAAYARSISREPLELSLVRAVLQIPQGSLTPPIYRSNGQISR